MFLPAVKDGVKENAPVPSQVTSANDKDREESSPVPPGNDHIDDHQTGKQTTTEAEQCATDYAEGAEGTFPLMSLILFTFYPNNTHLLVKNLK